MEAARQDWIRLLPSVSDPVDARALAFHIAYFDAGNWKWTGDGTQAQWEFRPPQDVQDLAISEMQETQQAAPRWQRAAAIKYCRHVLDGAAEVSAHDLRPLLEYAAGAEASPHADGPDDEEWLTGDMYTVRCAVAAVALVKMPSWLEEHPPWKARCKEWILSACSKHASFSMLEHPFPSPIGSWDRFCAHAIGALWSSAPEDHECRSAVAILVGASYHHANHHLAGDAKYDYRSRMFVELASFRRRLGDDFSRLLHLAVLFARLRHIGWAGPPDTSPNVDGAFSHFANAFVRGTLPLLPEDWPRLAIEWPAKLRRPRKWPDWVQAQGWDQGFDLAALVSAMAWLPSEAGNLKARDRKFVVDTMGRLDDVILRDLGEDQEDTPEQPEMRSTRLRPQGSDVDDRGHKGWFGRARTAFKEVMSRDTKPRGLAPSRQKSRTTPLPIEDTIARWCAAYVVREPDPAVRRRLWEPWLSRPPTRYYWAESFVSNLCLEGFAEVPATASFVDAWKEIFKYAIREGRWLDREAEGFSSISVARAFLRPHGIQFGQAWTAERSQVASVLLPYWERWAALAMEHSWCAKDFLWMLQAPAFKVARRDGLRWVATSKLAQWIEDDRAQEALVFLLQQVEIDRGDGLELRDDQRKAFMMLLDRLVAMQNREAIELARRIRPSL
ncbi:hypothetical protein [Polyangium fumosum]|uniref:Uncharacterized protein n=1 Tax=Polyangium fumosum TaxID=889272 RepID=A0A4U1I958_9BACT|nr:hypothetical protein [Polyangium fumosum]TKC90013.1 hypothetical protein E8A74_51225 [Polyangium fumosum]